MYTRSPPGRRVDGITGVERLDRQVELRARTSITPHLSRERLLCPHQSECLPCSHHELVYSCVLDVPFVWPRGRGDRREVGGMQPVGGAGDSATGSAGEQVSSREGEAWGDAWWVLVSLNTRLP